MNDSVNSPIETPPPEKPRRGWIWPWIVGGALGVTVIKYTIVLILISSDPSIAVEDDYYQRALAWDDRRSAQAASDTLGWNARISIGPAKSHRRSGEATITLVDADGAAIVDATVHVHLFHQARAARPIDAVARLDPAGIYRVPLPFARRGLWQIEVKATRRDEHFIETRAVVWGTAGKTVESSVGSAP